MGQSMIIRTLVGAAGTDLERVDHQGNHDGAEAGRAAVVDVLADRRVVADIVAAGVDDTPAAIQRARINGDGKRGDAETADEEA
jgi:hypothetical protein